MLLSLLLLAAAVAAPDPTPADGAAGSASGGPPLYQLLYAGEHGDAAHAAGQRLRARIWLDHLAPTPEQARALRELVALAAALRQEQDAERAALGAREVALLLPLYAELDALLDRPGASDPAALQDLATRIAAARGEVTAEADPAVTGFRRVTKLFEAARSAVRTFPADQREALGAARLLLERSVSPLRTPGADAAQLGGTWEAMDFAALKVDPRDAAADPLDIGGLWSTEKIDQAGNTDLIEAQLAAILMVAAQEPALATALGVAPPPPATAPAEELQ